MVLSMVCLPSFQVILLFSIHWVSTGAVHQTSCWRLQLRAAVSPRNPQGPGKLVLAWHSGPVMHKGENVNTPGGFSSVQPGRKGMVPDSIAAALLSAKALQLGAVTGKLCLPHNPNMNELDVTREPSWICSMGSSLAPYAVLTCISKKEQADSHCLLIIKGKGNVFGCFVFQPAWSLPG